MKQLPTNGTGVDFINAVGQKLEAGILRIGFFQVPKSGDVAGQELSGFNRLHDLDEFWLSDAQRNVFGFQESIQSFAAEFTAPTTLFNATEGSLSGGGQTVVDANNPRFQRL